MIDGSEEEWDSPSAWPNSWTATVNRSVLLSSPETLLDYTTEHPHWTPTPPPNLSDFHWNRLELIHTSIAPDLLIIKVCVSSHFTPAGEERVGQGATLPIKRVPVIVEQAVKRHFDVPSSYRPFAICQHSIEIQGGRITPGFEGMTQDIVHQTVGQARGQRWWRVTVDTFDKKWKYMLRHIQGDKSCDIYRSIIHEGELKPQKHDRKYTSTWDPSCAT